MTPHFPVFENAIKKEFLILLEQKKQSRLICEPGLLYYYSGDDLSSQGIASQVLSARAAFTSVFEKGTGGTPSLRPPETWRLCIPIVKYRCGNTP